MRVKNTPIIPLYENYGIWVACAYASFVLWIYQLVQIAADVAMKKEKNNFKPIAKLIKSDMSKQEFALLKLIYENNLITKEQIDHQLSSTTTTATLEKLISENIVDSEIKDEQIYYFINKPLKKYVGYKAYSI